MANQTRQLARLLGQEGVEVELVQVNAPYRPHWVGSWRGVRALFRLAPYLVRLWDAAGRVQLFHVMANSGWAWHLCAAPAIWIAKLRRIPVVVNYRGGNADEFFSKSYFWVGPTMRLADRLVVPSGFLQQVFAHFGLSTEVVPNVIDLGRFAPRPANPGARTDAPHLIVTRNLEPIYDIGTALRALSIVRNAWPGAHLTVAGSGPERNRLGDLAQTLGLGAHVTFSGRLDNDRIGELYRQADLFVNSSLVDNMPISILEALASGVPVVSTSVGGVPFLVEHQKTALLVAPNDADAMARAILDLLDHPAKAAQLAGAGRDSVQQYTWQNVRGRLFEVYSGLAPGTPGDAAAQAK
jgi:glycosyltransferase involved in cell wall biosynthesis